MCWVFISVGPHGHVLLLPEHVHVVHRQCPLLLHQHRSRGRDGLGEAQEGVGFGRSWQRGLLCKYGFVDCSIMIALGGEIYDTHEDGLLLSNRNHNEFYDPEL